MRYVGLLSSENIEKRVKKNRSFAFVFFIERFRNEIHFEPQRLQTLMTLYSNSLCGLVLLVPPRIRLTTGGVKESNIVSFISPSNSMRCFPFQSKNSPRSVNVQQIFIFLHLNNNYQPLKNVSLKFDDRMK